LAHFLVATDTFGINEGITRIWRQSRIGSFCAQRLSASTKESHAAQQHVAADEVVLNAFRHQRRNHRRLPVLRDPDRLCSTPFGINEGITNRQHDSTAANSRCSTPFGINEGITGMRLRRLLHALPCSTPFGINEGITNGRVATTRIGIKCSTPFGINEGITLPSTTRASRSECAQRLSASTKESHSYWALPVTTRPVLNAFRHQRRNHVDIFQ